AAEDGCFSRVCNSVRSGSGPAAWKLRLGTERVIIAPFSPGNAVLWHVPLTIGTQASHCGSILGDPVDSQEFSCHLIPTAVFYGTIPPLDGTIHTFMARQTAEQIERELDAVQDLLLRHPEGIGRADLERVYRESQGREIAPSALLRRLDRLVEEYRARVTGVGPTTVYLPVPVPAAASEPDPDYVPLSPDGARVRALIRRSAIEKEP